MIDESLPLPSREAFDKALHIALDRLGLHVHGPAAPLRDGTVIFRLAPPPDVPDDEDMQRRVGRLAERLKIASVAEASVLQCSSLIPHAGSRASVTTTIFVAGEQQGNRQKVVIRENDRASSGASQSRALLSVCGHSGPDGWSLALEQRGPLMRVSDAQRVADDVWRWYKKAVAGEPLPHSVFTVREGTAVKGICGIPSRLSMATCAVPIEWGLRIVSLATLVDRVSTSTACRLTLDNAKVSSYDRRMGRRYLEAVRRETAAAASSSDAVKKDRDDDANAHGSQNRIRSCAVELYPIVAPGTAPVPFTQLVSEAVRIFHCAVGSGRESAPPVALSHIPNPSASHAASNDAKIATPHHLVAAMSPAAVRAKVPLSVLSGPEATSAAVIVHTVGLPPMSMNRWGIAFKGDQRALDQACVARFPTHSRLGVASRTHTTAVETSKRLLDSFSASCNRDAHPGRWFLRLQPVVAGSIPTNTDTLPLLRDHPWTSRLPPISIPDAMQAARALVLRTTSRFDAVVSLEKTYQEPEATSTEIESTPVIDSDLIEQPDDATATSRSADGDRTLRDSPPLDDAPLSSVSRRALLCVDDSLKDSVQAVVSSHPGDAHSSAALSPKESLVYLLPGEATHAPPSPLALSSAVYSLLRRFDLFDPPTAGATPRAIRLARFSQPGRPTVNPAQDEHGSRDPPIIRFVPPLLWELHRGVTTGDLHDDAALLQARWQLLHDSLDTAHEAIVNEKNEVDLKTFLQLCRDVPVRWMHSLFVRCASEEGQVTPRYVAEVEGATTDVVIIDASLMMRWPCRPCSHPVGEVGITDAPPTGIPNDRGYTPAGDDPLVWLLSASENIKDDARALGSVVPCGDLWLRSCRRSCLGSLGWMTLGKPAPPVLPISAFDQASIAPNPLMVLAPRPKWLFRHGRCLGYVGHGPHDASLSQCLRPCWTVLQRSILGGTPRVLGRR